MAWVRGVLIGSAAVLALAACGRKDEAKPPAAPAPKPAVTGETAPAAGFPARRPGLWQQAMSAGEFKQVSKLCLDKATDEKLSVWGAGAAKEKCAKTEMSRGLDGTWSFSSVCDMGGGGKTTTSGTITGDFNAKYQMVAQSTTEGASAPQMNGPHKMALEATWLGPCPAGFKPGDMELPGGMKMNMAALAAK